MKMHLYERLKIDFLETSQGCYPTDIFSGRFQDVHRKFHQNCKNIWLFSISYNAFSEYDWKWYNRNEFRIMFKIDVQGMSRGHRYADINLGRN